MKNFTFGRLATLVIALVFILAACGSDSSSAAGETTPTTEEASTAQDTAETSDDDADDADDGNDGGEAAIEESAIPEGAEIDDRTEEEIIQDNLDGILIRLDVEPADLDEVSECIITRLEGEGIPVTGSGAAELVALVGCRQEIIGNILGINPAVATAEVRACALTAIGQWFSSIPLDEADVVLQEPDPPQSVRDQIVNDCDVDDETATAILG